MKTKLTILISLLSFACIGQSNSIKKLSENNVIGNLEYRLRDTTIQPLLIRPYGQDGKANFLNNVFYFNSQHSQQLVIKGDTVVIESPQLKFIKINGTTYEIIRTAELKEINKNND